MSDWHAGLRMCTTVAVPHGSTGLMAALQDYPCACSAVLLTASFVHC
jgi:hypothetical protein